MKTKRMSQEIILEPIVSEKSVGMKAQNQYQFKVHPKANKIEIRHAVEELFKVKVEGVNTMNCHGKKKRLGVFLGRTPDFKKAVVTLKAGEKIAFFEGI